MSFGRGSAVVWMAAAATFPFLSPTLQGQQLRSFMPQAPLAPTLRADPREPAVGGRLMWVAESATLFGTGLEGEAKLGTSFPLLLLSGEAADRAKPRPVMAPHPRVAQFLPSWGNFVHVLSLASHASW